MRDDESRTIIGPLSADLPDQEIMSLNRSLSDQNRPYFTLISGLREP